jgi:hypothetical protein
MNPLIKKCITTDGHTLKSITSACQFWETLHNYIQTWYSSNDTFTNDPAQVHSVFLLLDYPCSSNVRQRSHIDGEQNYFQGLDLCGNGISVTMEFPILSPHVQEAKDLEQLWSFPPRITVFSVKLRRASTVPSC